MAIEVGGDLAPGVDMVAGWACHEERRAVGSLGVVIPEVGENLNLFAPAWPHEINDGGVLAEIRGVEEIRNDIL